MLFLQWTVQCSFPVEIWNWLISFGYEYIIAKWVFSSGKIQIEQNLTVLVLSSSGNVNLRFFQFFLLVEKYRFKTSLTWFPNVNLSFSIGKILDSFFPVEMSIWNGKICWTEIKTFGPNFQWKNTNTSWTQMYS